MTGPIAPKLLIASDNAEDAAAVQKQLAACFESPRVSTHPDNAVADFEAYLPAVLVLAFDTVSKAERYSLAMYRHSDIARRHVHGTVLLCAKEELRIAFDLCKRGVFDDYVLHWPLSHDGLRLPMSCLNVARHSVPARPLASEDLRAHVSGIEDLDQMVARQLEDGRGVSTRLAQSFDGLQSALHAGRAAPPSGRGAGARPGAAPEADVRLRQLAGAAGRGVADLSAWQDRLRDSVLPRVAELRASGQRLQAQRRTVLIVEDDEFARAFAANALAGQPFDLAFAPDGAAALASIHRILPDLILMDVRLPDGDGIELTRKIRATRQMMNVPVLMLTSDARRQTLQDSRDAGATDFMVKPYTAEALVERMKALLARHSKVA